VCQELQLFWVFHAQQFPVCIKNGPPPKGHPANLIQLWEALESTLNLALCEFVKATVSYLGKEVGHGQVRPVDAKVLAISAFPAPTARRELRRFLGMVGYYPSFCKLLCGSCSIDRFARSG
jgi:hypothetical protein